jgi:cytoskeletal protein CcmA (bactofilin family)
VTATGNVTAGYYLGNGAFMTGLNGAISDPFSVANATVSGALRLTTGSTIGNSGIVFSNASYRGGLVEKRTSAIERYGLGFSTGVTSVYAGTAGNASSVRLGFALNESSFINGLIVARNGSSVTTANVGVNTTSPQAALHVVGDIKANGSVTADGNVTTGNVTVIGSVATGSVATGTLTAAGNVSATGNVSAGNVTTTGIVATGTLTATGNVSAGNVTTTGIVASGTLTATGSVSAAGNVSATGNVSAGNVTTTGIVATGTLTTTGNVSAGNVTTTGIVATGTLTATGSVSAGGNVSATGNVSAGNVTATGNVSAGNVTTTGIVATGTLTATGNVTAGYYLGNGAFMTGLNATVSDPFPVANATVSGALRLTTGSTIGNSGIVFGNASYQGGLVENRTSASERYGLGFSTGVTSVYAGTAGTTSSVRLGFALTESSFIDGMVVARNGSNLLTANVGVNTTSPQAALHVVGDIMANGTVYATGDVTAFSDLRLKTDLRPIDARHLGGMVGYTFTRPDLGGSRHAGLIAQDVQAALPEAVVQVGEYLSVSYAGVVGMLVNAVNELSARVQMLEAISPLASRP